MERVRCERGRRKELTVGPHRGYGIAPEADRIRPANASLAHKLRAARVLRVVGDGLDLTCWADIDHAEILTSLVEQDRHIARAGCAVKDTARDKDGYSE